MDSYIAVPLPVLKRFPLYVRLLREHRERGAEWISSGDIASRLGLKDIQVRKDLACTGVCGIPRKGFPLTELLDAVEYYLGGKNCTDVFLIGAGPLGRALAAEESITRHGFKIVAVFDPSPGLVGARVEGHEVLSLGKLEDLARRMGVKLAVLAVPEVFVPELGERLVRAGIRGIWNFSTVYFEHPKEVFVIQEDLGAKLALLSGEVTRIGLS